MTILVLMFLSISAFGFDDCAPIRLDSPGKSMHRSPIYNQRDIGNCYAVSAAELIDAYRYSHGEADHFDVWETRTSPLALAQKYENIERSLPGKEKKPLILPIDSYSDFYNSGGFTRTLINRIRDPQTGKVEICDHVVVSGYIEKESDIRKIFAHWKAESPLTLPGSKLEYCEVRKERAYDFAKAIKTAAVKSNVPDFLSAMMTKVCQNTKKNVFVPEPLFFDRFDTDGRNNDALKRQMHSVLNIKNPQPIEISYCPSILDDKNSSLASTPPCKPDHSSVIIGRRRNDAGKCEFLMRNSWGKECTSPVYIGSKCEKGQYWIEEDQLIKNTRAWSALLDKASKDEWYQKMDEYYDNVQAKPEK